MRTNRQNDKPKFQNNNKISIVELLFLTMQQPICLSEFPHESYHLLIQLIYDFFQRVPFKKFIRDKDLRICRVSIIGRVPFRFRNSQFPFMPTVWNKKYIVYVAS